MSELVEIRLGREAAEYMRQRLRRGNTLARYLLERHDLDRGTIVTFLPPGLSEEDIEDLESGGNLPPPGPSKCVTLPGGARGIAVPVSDEAAPVLAARIRAFLYQEERGLCVFEDAWSDPGEPRPEHVRDRMLTRGKEVYFACTGELEAEAIRRTFRVIPFWILLGAMTSMPQVGRFPRRRGNVSRGELRSLAENTKKIIVGAYDGESYLIWSRP